MNQFSSLKRNIAAAGLFAAVFILLPVTGLSNFELNQITLFFIWACVALQWNLVFGVSGIQTLGHAAVFGVGAYSTAMIGSYSGLPFITAFLLSAPIGMAFSLLLGVLTTKMREDYVAIATLAVTVLVHNIVISDVECFRKTEYICYNFTGGTRGLLDYGDFGWLKLLGFAHRAYGDYYLALLIFILGFVFSILIIFGPFGLAFRAIRDNETYARSRGIDFRKYQIIVFGVSGVFTGLAGGAYAGFIKTVGPNLLSPDLLIFILSMMIVGGRGSTWGPILGTAALMIVDYLFQAYGAWRTGGLAIITIFFIVVYPQGLAGAATELFSRMFRRRQISQIQINAGGRNSE